MIKKPEKLTKNSLIAISAPAGPFSKKNFKEKLELLKPYTLTYNKNIFNKNNYTAGSIKARSNDLKEKLEDKNIKLLLFARGGYGSIHTLNSINKISPKIIMGYSDNTNILLYAYKKAKLISFYGPNFTSSYFNNNTLKYLSGANKKPIKIKLKTLNYAKDVSGPIIGGCLSVIVSLIGTKYLPSFKNHILFIEDTNEPTYKLDRYLQELYHANLLKDVKAIIIGSLKNKEKNWKQAFYNLLNFIDLPIYYNLKIGHLGFTTFLPLGLGVSIEKEILNIPYPFKK